MSAKNRGKSAYRLKQNRGKGAYRLKQSPGERAFSGAWERWNETTGRVAPILDWLMGDGNKPAHDTTDRDRLVAATVVQWLGSPVGQTFLLEAQSTENKP